MVDILVPHAIVVNALVKYAEERYKQLSSQLYGANVRLDMFGIDDPMSAVYTNQMAEDLARLELFRRLKGMLDGPMPRVIIDYGEIKFTESPIPVRIKDSVLEAGSEIQLLPPGDG